MDYFWKEFLVMNDTITIKLLNKEARSIIEGLEAIKAIDIVDDKIPAHWSPKKKKQTRDFLAALQEAKLAEQGKIELKTAESLLNEL